MGDVWFVGPLMIQEKWGLYAIAFIFSYMVVRLAIRLKSIHSSVIDVLWNALFLFLVVWKVSYGLFHPIEVVNNPLSLLYFTGGDKGVVLAFASVFIYFLLKGKSNGYFNHVYMELGFISILAAIGVYQTILWMMYDPGVNHDLFGGIVSLVLVLIWFLNYETNAGPLWIKLILWFSLGQLFLSFFKPQMPLFLGFSFSQWVYIFIGFLVIVATERNFTKT